MDYSPVGESTTFRYGNCQAKYFENVFPTRILFTVLYFVSLVAGANLTSFLWQEGGAPTLTLNLLYRSMFDYLLNPLPREFGT